MKKPTQCRAKYFLMKQGQCQGCSGHKGPHWFYDPTGSLIQWKNPNDNTSSKLLGKNVGSRWTPPDHSSYIHPAKMRKMAFRYLQAKWAMMMEKLRLKRLKR